MNQGAKRKSRARLGKIGHSGWVVRSQRGLSTPDSMREGPRRQRGPRGPPSPGRGHGVGKAAGTGAREQSTRGQGARRDEGRSREGAVRMVRRSRRRKLQKFTGLCGREGLRVRGGRRGKGSKLAARGQGRDRLEKSDQEPGGWGGATLGSREERWEDMTAQSWKSEL